MQAWGIGLSALQQGMRVAALRHAVVSDNVANATTPGFRVGRVVFEEELQRRLQASAGRGMAQTHAGHLRGAEGGPVEPRVVREAVRQGPDGNAVDIEREMALLSQNQLWYAAMTRLTGDHLGRLRLAIDGR